MQIDLFPVKSRRRHKDVLELKSPAERSLASSTKIEQERTQERSNVPAERARMATQEPPGGLTGPSTLLDLLPRGSEPLSTLEYRRLEWMDQVRALTRRSALKRARLMLIGGMSSPSRASAQRFAGSEIPGTSGARAADAPATVMIDGIPCETSQWHAKRANGMVSKWDRIAACKDSTSGLQSECGCETNEYKIGCGHRECPKCRKIRSARLRRDVKRARISLRTAAKERKIERSIRERFLTLTIPHLPHDGTTCPERRRVVVIYEAWNYFAGWLRKHLKFVADKNADLVHFWRMFEWTEGKDQLGHPHFHVWIHSPWLDQDLVHSAWANAIERAAGERLEVAIPDIRAVRNGVEDELVKYMLKDLSDVNHGEFVSAVTVAHVIDELIGRRRRQTSAGLKFWIDLALKSAPQRAACSCCGIEYCYRFVVLRDRQDQRLPDIV